MGSVAVWEKLAGASHEDKGFPRGGFENFRHRDVGFGLGFEAGNHIRDVVISEFVANFKLIQVFEGCNRVSDEESFIGMVRKCADDAFWGREAIVLQSKRSNG
jgi:hypothetical protein